MRAFSLTIRSSWQRARTGRNASSQYAMIGFRAVEGWERDKARRAPDLIAGLSTRQMAGRSTWTRCVMAMGRTSETGETGEHLVLAELYRRGVLGGQVARGARGIDLLTSTGPTLQVKAKRGTGRWVLGQLGRRPAVDVVVLVSVGDQHRDDQFFVVPVGELYDKAEARHRAYWDTRPGAVSGELGLVQLRDGDPDVKEFLDEYRDKWELVSEPAPRVPELGSA
jgi:hypothetical protein